MKWWIMEDALCDGKGHWVEYLDTFRRGLEELDDAVHFFASCDAEAWVVERFRATPCLPRSIWRRISEPASKATRLFRIPAHGWATFRRVKRRLSTSETKPDWIFVPTVMVHHLLGWWLLLKVPLRKYPNTRVLLFFPNTPVCLDPNGRAYFPKNPTARLFRWLIRRLAGFVESGQLVLGAETEPMRKALSEATGVSFRYLPHPVEWPATVPSAPDEDSKCVHFGAYGAARHEKGSDVLLAAIERFLRKHPEANVKFSIQWLGDFEDDFGKPVTRSEFLLDHPKVSFIESYFEGDGYHQQLCETDVMLLPYGPNYALRVSRVVIEAMLYGMPVVASRNTTLFMQASAFGDVEPCEMNNVDSLVDALDRVTSCWQSGKWNCDPTPAEKHFSVHYFRECLLEGLLQ